MTDPGSHRRRRRRRDGGYSIVEASIALPVLVVLVLLVVQYALIWHARHLAEAAAQDALRGARGYQASAAAGQRDGTDDLRQVAPHLLTGTRVDVTRTAQSVTVHVHGRVLSLLSFGTFTVEETAAGRVERYVTPGPTG